MRSFFLIWRHELWKLFITPGTYIAGILFLVVMGFVFQDILTLYTRQPREDAPATLFFQLFWLPVFFMVPLLTMRSLAEEKHSGTLETLMTTPVTTPSVVLGKFLAAYCYYTALWAMTFSFHYVVYRISGEAILLDAAPLAGGYFFVALSGLLFIGLGILASSLCRSQLVAGILAFTFLFVVIVGGRYLVEITLFTENQPIWMTELIEHLQIFQHAEDFASGIIDTRAIVLYFSGAAVCLYWSILAIDSRILRG